MQILKKVQITPPYCVQYTVQRVQLSHLHEVSIFGLVVEDIQPGVLVERGVIVRGLQHGGHVQAVRQGLQGHVPRVQQQGV